MEHSKRITEIVKEKIEKRKKDRIGRQSAISYDFSKYHNQFHEMVSKEEKAFREMEQKKEEERKKLKQQQEEYDKAVRENFKPKVSEAKRIEL